MVMNVELQATCSALGYQEKGKGYVREPECLETVKDLIRFLKREDDTYDIRRQLGHGQILQNDLLPIIKNYHKDRNLFEAVVRLLVNVTQPAILCFQNHIPDDKTMRNYYLEIETHLQNYKEAFIDDQLFSVLTEKLGDLLKLDWEHRHEEDRLLIERLLILIRNVLHVPPNIAGEQRTDDDANTHDQILWTIHTSGMEDLLLYVASSDEERQLSLHVLEIISLMFREQSPEILACAGVQRSMTEKEKDERELEMMREQELAKKKANLLKFSTRHSRFGGTYVVKNMKSISDREMIYHKTQSDVDNIKLDNNKKHRKIPKNQAPIKDQEVVRRSMLSIRLGLKEFCVQFLENCYNPLMHAVKDILNREKSQEHDETYYLWAMRFFMEFCRHHSKQVELVSETISVPAFHYIQIQLFNYYEMALTDKKEAKVWGKRMHLALKAYQELLMTLNAMDTSKNTRLMESSKVIKSNVFYMMEFRDIFLTLLKKFDGSKQSRTYLKDLIETAHLFLKMLESFCKGSKHVIVQNKKKSIKRKKKQQSKKQASEFSDQQLEDMWDDVAGELSAIFQGRADIPDDVTPFDAASEVEFEQQRIDAVLKIQDALRERKPGESVALFRAAREVWPENDQFGSPDILPEDEFMALREIFMTLIPRPSDDVPPNPEDELEEIINEVEEEEMQTTVVSETELNFKEFLIKFAKAEILKVYVLLLADYQKNSTYTNHCIVKMLHRLSVDLELVGMTFQASLFRVFQEILLSPLVKTARYKEIAKFSTYVIGKFVETAEKNKKIFMELLFWKGSRDSIEIIDGYGCGNSSSRAKLLWTEDQEVEVCRLWEEYKDNDEGKDIVDCIMEHITDDTKTRSHVIRELKRQQLITSAKELKRKTGGVRAGPWREEQELELRELFDRFRDSDDPLGNILGNLTAKRGKAKVVDKILSMELILDKKELYKKRGHASGHRKKKNASDDDGSGQENEACLDDDNEGSASNLDDNGVSDSSEGSSDSEDDTRVQANQTLTELENTNHENTSIVDIIRSVVESGYRQQIGWIEKLLRRAAEDRDDSDAVSVPIVPLTEENETAMEDEIFMSFLKRIGISPPITGQEAFWRIPDTVTTEGLESIADGLELNESGQPVAADKIPIVCSRKTKKKEKTALKIKKTKVNKKNSERFRALQAMAQKTKATKKLGRKRSSPKKKSASDEDENSDTNLKTLENSPGPISMDIDEGKTQKSPANLKISRRVRRIVESDSEDRSSPKKKQPASDEDENSDTNLKTLENSPGPISMDIDEGKSQKSPANLKISRRVRRIVESDSDDSDDDKLVIDGDLEINHQNTSDVETSHPVSQSQSQKRPLVFGSDSDDDQQRELTDSQPNKRARLFNSDDSSDEDVPLISANNVQTESFPATMFTQPPEDSDSESDDHIPLRKVLQSKRILESDAESQ